MEITSFFYCFYLSFSLKLVIRVNKMELTIILMLVILLIISNAYWIKKIKTNQFDNKEDYNSANIKALEETVERYRIMLHETKKTSSAQKCA